MNNPSQNKKLKPQSLSVRELARNFQRKNPSELPPQSEFLKKPFPLSGKKWDELLQVKPLEPGDLELLATVAPQSKPNLSPLKTNEILNSKI